MTEGSGARYFPISPKSWLWRRGMRHALLVDRYGFRWLIATQLVEPAPVKKTAKRRHWR